MFVPLLFWGALFITGALAASGVALWESIRLGLRKSPGLIQQPRASCRYNRGGRRRKDPFLANRHFGNLADVFKHLVLCQTLGRMRPTEYWESHAGSALYDEATPIPTERAHGIHTFCKLAATLPALRSTPYARALGPAVPLPQIPGSPLLARRILGEGVRRMLLCDTDADSLHSIQKCLRATAGQRELAPEALECVQDDGITVLRGAGMLLPEPWKPAALAFIDPYDITENSAAGITPLELACELANRSIAALVFYAFPDEAGRARTADIILQTLTKSRLMHRSSRFEGCLQLPAEGAPTQWGFGMLALRLAPEILDEIHQLLRTLEAAYRDVPLTTPAVSGAWTCRRMG